MKTMRKITALALITVLALGTAFAYGESSGWDLAFAMLERETGITRDQADPCQIVHEDGVWGFSVKLKEHPEDEDGLLVCDMDKNGNMISIEGPEKINLERQLENDLKACFHREDCAWRMAEVCARWQVKLACVSEAEKERIWPLYLGVVGRGIIAPPEGALDCNAALTAAMDASSARMGWTEAIDLNTMYVPCITACYMLDGEPVWFVYLEDHSYFEKEYSTDRAMKQYQARLEEAFATIDQVPPCKIGIVIDAFTGELKEKPMLDYIPVEFNYLEFLVRTDEAVASIAE